MGRLRDPRGHDDSPSRRRLHIGFYAPTRELVDAFHRAGVEAGYRDDGAPGPRPRVRRPTTTAASCSTPTATASKRSTPRRSARPARSTTCGCARRRRSRQALLRDDRAVRRHRVGRHARPRAIRLRERLVLVRRRRGAHRERAPRVRRERRTRPSTPSTVPRSRPATATTARPASDRSTTPATTARSCSTPTATTSRPSTTTADRVIDCRAHRTRLLARPERLSPHSPRPPVADVRGERRVEHLDRLEPE